MSSEIFPVITNGHLNLGPTFKTENFPTDALVAAFGGTVGTPGPENKFVTEEDSRYVTPVKIAMGKTTAFGGSEDTGRTVTVNLTTGSTSSGTYIGSIGLDPTKTFMFCAFAGGGNAESYGPGHSTISSTPYSTSPFTLRVYESTFGTHIHQGTYWIAIEAAYAIRS